MQELEEASKYQQLVSKWIHIYAELLDENIELEAAANYVCINVPFNYAKPQSVAAVCIWAGANKLKKSISPKEIIRVSAISLTTFQNIKKYFKKRGMVG